MKNLQSEIYETWELWKDDKDDDFYDTYIYVILEDFPKQRNQYLTYWESLKKQGGDEPYP